jgi:hypothetical protein
VYLRLLRCSGSSAWQPVPACAAAARRQCAQAVRAGRAVRCAGPPCRRHPPGRHARRGCRQQSHGPASAPAACIICLRFTGKAAAHIDPDTRPGLRHAGKRGAARYRHSQPHRPLVAAARCRLPAASTGLAVSAGSAVAVACVSGCSCRRQMLPRLVTGLLRLSALADCCGAACCGCCAWPDAVDGSGSLAGCCSTTATFSASSAFAGACGFCRTRDGLEASLNTIRGWPSAVSGTVKATDWSEADCAPSAKVWLNVIE